MTIRIELEQTSSSAQVYRLDLLDECNQTVGYATGEFRRYAVWFNGQPHFFLDQLVIPDKDHRQQGFGSQLVKAVEAFARNQGASWIRGQFVPSQFASTSADERALSAFWNKNGYGLKREIYDNSIRFWKPLRSATKSRPVGSASPIVQKMAG
jgi:GNAT superfamily N-acetyltransferase